MRQTERHRPTTTSPTAPPRDLPPTLASLTPCSRTTRKNPLARAPEWMVSFADMITILMSFFVVMFSIASGDSNNGTRGKKQAIAIESMQYRFGPKWRPFMAWSTMPGNSYLPGGGKGLGSVAPATGSRRSGRHALGEEGAGANPRRGPGRHNRHRRLGSLSAGQHNAGRRPRTDAFQRITGKLRGKPQIVEIVATASRSPLPLGCHFRDRWELGYARCRATAALLSAANVEPERFRLSVVPGNDADSVSGRNEQADDAVRVILSATLPSGGQ